MKLSVVIPSFNEEKTIKKLLDAIYPIKLEKEIIIVDDSTDNTKKILKQEAKNHKEIKLIFPEKREGKGSAIRVGLKLVTGNIVIIQDADLEYDPNDYFKLIKPIIEGRTKIVYGSRMLNKKNKFHYNPNLFATKLLSALSNILYGTKITDEPTCYKVFKTEVLKNIELTCKGFEFCPEVTAKVSKKGYKIVEVPISYTPRTIEEGKKINWRDGLVAIWTLLKYRLIE